MAKNQAIIDIIAFPVFVAFTGVLLWKSVEMSWASTLLLERSNSEWNSPVWPIKWMIPIGAFLLLMQGISKFHKDLIIVFQKNEQDI